jgi:hypothetical protein
MYIGISTSNLSTKVPVSGPAQFVLLDGGALNDNKYIKCFPMAICKFPREQRSKLFFSIKCLCSPFCRLLQSCYRAWLRPLSGAEISVNLNENAALVYVIINFKLYFERPGKCCPDQKKSFQGSCGFADLTYRSQIIILDSAYW